MYLCHKCAGVLCADKNEDVSGLTTCRCISGYVREGYRTYTRPEAIHEQLRQAKRDFQHFSAVGSLEQAKSALADINALTCLLL